MLSIIRKIYDLSIKTKFILFVTVLGMIPILIMMGFLMNSLTTTSVNVENNALEETLTLIKQEVLNQANAKAEMYNMVLKSLIIDLNEIGSDVPESENIQKLFSGYRLKHQIISRIFIINAAENTLTASPNTKDENLFTKKDKIFSLAKYKKSYVGEWSNAYWDSEMETQVISYALPIHTNNEFFGIIGFDIKLDDFFNEIVSIDPSQSSYFFMVKNNGVTIRMSDAVYDDFQLDKNKKDANLLDSPLSEQYNFQEILSSISKNEGLFTINEKSGQNQKLVAFAMVPSLGSKIIIVSPINEIIQIQRERASELRRAIRKVGVNGAIAVMFIAMVMAVVSFYLSEKVIVQPILQLKEGIDNLEKNNLKAKIEVKSNDEIGKVMTSFNKMAIELVESKKALEDYSKNLEKKIAERTKELNVKNEELEKFNQFAVNREQKIIELKDKVKKLEKKKK